MLPRRTQPARHFHPPPTSSLQITSRQEPRCFPASSRGRYVTGPASRTGICSARFPKAQAEKFSDKVIRGRHRVGRCWRCSYPRMKGCRRLEGRLVQWDGIENEAHIETMVLSSGLNLDVDLFQNPLRSRKSLHNEQDVIAAPNAWTTARLSLGFGIVYPTGFYERRRRGCFR